MGLTFTANDSPSPYLDAAASYIVETIGTRLRHRIRLELRLVDRWFLTTEEASDTIDALVDKGILGLLCDQAFRICAFHAPK